MIWTSKAQAPKPDLGDVAEAIVISGGSRDDAVDAVLGHLGLTRSDLGSLEPRRLDALAAELRQWSVNEDIRSDDLARSGKDSRPASAASDLLSEVSGLVARGGLPPGEDPRSLELRAVADLALRLVDQDVDEDAAVAQLLNHVGVQPDRLDRLKSAARKAPQETLRATASLLRRDARTNAGPESERERLSRAAIAIDQAWLRIDSRGR